MANVTVDLADEASLSVLKRMKKEKIETAWDRLEAQQPQCGFGQSGICCKNCNMGPCVINPFGKAPQRGVCGADADTIAARNFLRLVAGGASAHSDHGRGVAELLVAAAKGEAEGYQVTDEVKLRQVAGYLGIPADGKSKDDLAIEVGETCLAEFGKSYGYQLFAKRAPEPRQKIWTNLGVMPRSIDREIVEVMHRTSEGVDQDYRHLMLQAHRCALADGWGGSMIATELQDILFGTPRPVKGEINLGVLKGDEVNIIVHGHEPSLSEMIALASQDPELIAEANKAGAKDINLSGICCTANELLIRHGVPVAGNMRMQEMAVATGAVEMMVVDVQCFMQGLSDLVKHYHTQLITTSPKARIAGAEHMEFHEDKGLSQAKEIVRRAIANFSNRDKSKVFIPDTKQDMIAGFSHEAIRYMLGGTFRASYRPLNDNIINGRIRGVAGVVGCTNPKCSLERQTYVELVKELVANNILVIMTGCGALECGKQGLLLPDVQAAAGPGLAEVCETVGIAPVLHSGSCVDNSRILIAASAIVEEGGLGEDISDVPAVGACTEWMHEKAISIGHYFVSSGVYTIFGIQNPIVGSRNLTKFLCEEIEADLGGKWGFETDMSKMAAMMIDHIEKKRDALGINVEAERKLYDMEDRRHLVV